MVTVVDASTFAEQLNSLQALRDRPDLMDSVEEGGKEAEPLPPELQEMLAGMGPGGETAPNPAENRAVVDLLVEQVETADVIVLNKLDCITSEETQLVRALVTELNGYAKVVDAEFGVVPLDAILPSAKGMPATETDLDTVAESNEVMDHKASVDMALFKAKEEAGSGRGAAVASTTGEAESCPPDCTLDHDHSHSHAPHDHGHSHDHAHDHAADCGPECTDPTHDHSHSHAHTRVEETTASERFGINTFVYQRRRPFDRERLDKVLEDLRAVQREQAGMGKLREWPRAGRTRPLQSGRGFSDPRALSGSPRTT